MVNSFLLQSILGVYNGESSWIGRLLETQKFSTKCAMTAVPIMPGNLSNALAQLIFNTKGY